MVINDQFFMGRALSPPGIVLCPAIVLTRVGYIDFWSFFFSLLTNFLILFKSSSLQVMSLCYLLGFIL